MDALDDLHRRFQVEHLLLFETDFWIWSLRPVQTTLGASILSLKRECLKLSDLEEEEGSDFARITRTMEGHLSAFVQPKRINYLALMMIDPQLHFHVVPRYPGVRSFHALEWSDLGWPGLPVLNSNEEISTVPVLRQIRDALRTSLQL